MCEQTKNSNNYSSEFKESAVKPTTESDRQAVRDLGLNGDYLE